MLSSAYWVFTSEKEYIAMDYSSITSITSIALGGLIMLAAIFQFRRIFQLLAQFAVEDASRLSRLLKANLALMIFFFLGYFIVLGATLFRLEFIGELFVGVIFLFGGVFVYIVIQAYVKMLISIQEKYQTIVQKSIEIGEEKTELIRLNAQLNEHIEVRKKTEEELEELNLTLEEQVESRTRELARKATELEIANSKLIDLDELKTSFVTSVSHELRTPTASILGFSKMVKRDFERHFSTHHGREEGLHSREERIMENLNVVVKEGVRLTRLINDMLDISKIESGQMEWKNRIINTAEFIKRVGANAAGQFLEKQSVNFETRCADNLPDLFVDPDRIEQVLLNLLNNSYKFTTVGSVALTAEMGRNGMLRFMVIDTGPGIHEEDVSKLFAQFTQLTDSQFEKRQGAGLGLIICKQIIEHYGGHIWVESVPGQGSMFIFTLPPARIEENTTGGAQPPE